MVHDNVIRVYLKTNQLVDILATCSKQQHGRPQPRQPDVATDIQTAAARQHDVQDDQVERQSSGLFEALLTIGREIYDITLALQTVAQGHPQCLFIFYQQYILVHFRIVGSPSELTDAISNSCFSTIGKRSVKTLPTASSLTTESVPPIASAMFLARDNPNPVP